MIYINHEIQKKNQIYLKKQYLIYHTVSTIKKKRKVEKTLEKNDSYEVIKNVNTEY